MAVLWRRCTSCINILLDVTMSGLPAYVARVERDFSFLGPVGTELAAFGSDLCRLTLRDCALVMGLLRRAVAGREVDLAADNPGFFSANAFWVVVFEGSQTGGLLTTVRTVVAVSVESLLDEDEPSSSHPLCPPSALHPLLVLTVDAATMSANVSVTGAAAVRVSGNIRTASTSLFTSMPSSGVPVSCKPHRQRFY